MKWSPAAIQMQGLFCALMGNFAHLPTILTGNLYNISHLHLATMHAWRCHSVVQSIELYYRLALVFRMDSMQICSVLLSFSFTYQSKHCSVFVNHLRLLLTQQSKNWNHLRSHISVSDGNSVRSGLGFNGCIRFDLLITWLNSSRSASHNLWNYVLKIHLEF